MKERTRHIILYRFKGYEDLSTINSALKGEADIGEVSTVYYTIPDAYIIQHLGISIIGAFEKHMIDEKKSSRWFKEEQDTIINKNVSLLIILEVVFRRKISSW